MRKAALMQKPKNRFPRRDNLVVLAYFLLVGSFFTQAFGLWHGHEINLLREEYLKRYGAIEVPTPYYFDTTAVMVGIPVLLTWFLLQLASAIAFCCNWRRRVSCSDVFAYLVVWFLGFVPCLVGLVIVIRD